jgi:rod shape-determining protein MreD
VKTLINVIALVLAVSLQAKLGNMLMLGTAPLDLTLIAVVYIAMTSGPTVGLLAGMCAGLGQDALSGGIMMGKHTSMIGIGSLANTVVGYVVGPASTQFIVTGVLPRFVTFFGSTIIHAVIFMGLYELLGIAQFGFPWAGVLGQAAANAIVGVVILQALELIPGAAERRQNERANGFRATRRLE